MKEIFNLKIFFNLSSFFNLYGKFLKFLKFIGGAFLKDLTEPNVEKIGWTIVTRNRFQKAQRSGLWRRIVLLWTGI
jgi:hypothetical protein